MDFQKAQQLLTTFTDARRKNALEQQALSGVAQLAAAREDWNEAETRLREFLKNSPDDLPAHQHLARSLFRQSKAQEAYAVLKKAKEIDRRDAARPGGRELLLPAEAMLAKLYAEYDGPGSQSADHWYQRALTQAPDDLPTRVEVAIWALGEGKLAFAEEQADAVLRIEAADLANSLTQRRYADSTVGRALHGLVALWKKDWVQAEHDFEKVILESPTDVAARNNIALALVEQNDPVKKRRALEYVEANYRDMNNSPDALPTLGTLGWVYYRRGEFAHAELALELAVNATNDKTDPDTATYLAHVLVQQGKDWQAKEVLEKLPLKAGRRFSMRPEALKLYEKVKDAKKPEGAPAAKKL
jgi:tetratricopeptide (TPR) repeat protein